MRFTMLGPLEARRDGARVVLAGARQRAVLAALLANANHVVSAERLAMCVWGADADAVAKARVQVQISRLRRTLGEPDVIVTTASGYELRVARTDVDALHFEDLVRAAEAAESNEAIRLVDAALHLWRGAPDPAFPSDEVLRLDELRLRALELRSAAAIATGLHAEIVAELRALASEHPEREELTRQLMLALYAAGRHSEALEAFRRCRDHLRDELGLEVSPALRELENAILRHEVGGASQRTPWPVEHVARSLPALRASDPVFVGRANELGTLRAEWRDSSGGARRGVVIAGEPGIGKTRLIAEFAREVARDGGLVLYGKCDDGIAAPAQPFGEALSALLAEGPPDLAGEWLGDRAADLLPVLPSLPAHAAREASVSPVAAVLRTLDAVRLLLDGVATARPLLLVLDDLHWADELSVNLFRHVVRGDESIPLLVAATYRDTEPSRSPSLRDVLDGLARSARITRLELDGLQTSAVAEMLERSAHEPSRAEAVREATRGNPFFVGEVVRALHGHPDAATAVTGRARDLVRSRLARLPERAKEVLAIAAVLGARAEVDVVAKAAGIELEQALDGFEAAEQARLVEAMDGFTFAHALVRHAILDDLPASRRARLHGRLAHALETVAATRRVAPGDLAVHFAAAGVLVDPAATVRYARAAAEDASARLAFDVAAEHYGQALRALERISTPAEPERLALQLAFGHALRLAGDDRAAAVLRELAITAEGAGDGATMADAVLSMALGLEARFLREDTRLVNLARRALALLADEDAPVRARLLGFLAHAAAYSLSAEERESLSARALAMARRVDDVTALVTALTARSRILVGPGDQDERLALANELVALGRRGPPYAEADGHLFRHFAFVELGDREAADAALAAAQASARLPISRWNVSVWTANRALLAGRFADAERESFRAGEAALEAGLPSALAQPFDVAITWFVRAMQGRLAELEPLFRRFTHPMTDVPSWVFVSAAQLALACDDRSRARDALAEAFRAGLLRQPSGITWAPTLAAASEVAAALADRPRAANLHALLAPHAHVIAVTAGPLALPVGMLAHELDRLDEAETLFRYAAAVSERMGFLPYLIRARYLLGQLLLPRDEGRQLVEQARAQAGESGVALVSLPAADHAPN